MSPINYLTDDENINSMILDIYNSVSISQKKNIHIIKKIDNILNMNNHRKVVIALIMLIIAIRDKSGDKGYRFISRKMFIYLYKKYPKLVKISLSTYIEVGYFKDLNYIIADLYNDGFDDSDYLIKACYQLYADQFKKDLRNYNEDKSISLCVKYIPKPSNIWQKKYGMVNKLISYIYPDVKNKIKAKNRYRKEYVLLNKYSSTTEALMSHNDWEDIDYGKVPVKCQVRNIMSLSSKCSNSFNSFMKNQIYKYHEYIDCNDIVDKIINYNFDEKLCSDLETYWNRCVRKYKINLETHIISLDIDYLTSRDIAIVLMMLDISHRQNNIFGGKLLVNDMVYSLFGEGCGYKNLGERIKFLKNLVVLKPVRSLISTITSYADKTGIHYNDIPKNMFIMSDRKYNICPKTIYYYDLVNNLEYMIANVVCWNIREKKIKKNFNTPNRFDLKINVNYISGNGKLFIDFILNNSIYNNNCFPKYLDYLYRKKYETLYLVLNIAYTFTNREHTDLYNTHLYNSDIDDDLKSELNWASYSDDESINYQIDTLEEPIKTNMDSFADDPIDSFADDPMDIDLENPTTSTQDDLPKDTLEDPIVNMESTLDQSDELVLGEEPGQADVIVSNEQTIDHEELNKSDLSNSSWFNYLFNRKPNIKIELKYNEDYCIIDKE